MKTKTYIIPEKTGQEYYNLGTILSFNDSIGQENLTLGDVLGRDTQAKMTRLKVCILGLPQYKYMPSQRKIIELMVEGYNETDVSEKLGLSRQYVSLCLINFRKYAKKYLPNLRGSGRM